MVARTLATRAPALNAGRRLIPPLVLMTDQARVPDPLAAARRLPPGSAVILRDRDDPARRATGERLARIARRRGLLLLVAGDAELAEHLKADGVHLPEAELHRAPTIRRRHGRWLMLGAAHSAWALRRAASLGVHAALLSPVFPTRSHPGAPTLGPLRFAALLRCARVPVIALGGIDAKTARRLPPGIAGIAAIDALSGASQAPLGGRVSFRRA
jgi:thiamine-phosphate pyrophosphorylase